jgi:ribonucleoside-diphosphate reductase alpha chain
MERQVDGGGINALGRYIRPDVPVSLSPNALAVLRKRYLLQDEQGRPAETAEEMLWRVALHVALAERLHGADDARVQETAGRFYRMMAALDFLPNSPSLMNAGRRLGQYFACFVLPVADSIIDDKDEGIFDTLRSAAFIHKTGGGTGFDFSRIRPESTRVDSTHGRASGPVSFMRVFNAATDAIHQGGFRRGANMGILRVDHPDILDFINAKSRPGELTNFNLSIAVTDEFLRALRGNLKHYVVDPHTGKKGPLREKLRDAEGNVTGTGDQEWSARELYDLVVRRAWESGEPGLFFVDRANRFNPTPALGEITSTNPCVPGDTWTMTEDGPRRVKDLVGKSVVLILDGERYPADQGFFETGEKPLVEVITREGYRFRATPDHRVRRVSRLTRHLRDVEWIAAGSLNPGDHLVLNDHRELPGWPGPGTSSDGYLLGILLGDGTLKEESGVICVRGEGEGPDSTRAAALRAVEGLARRSDFRGFGKPIVDRDETRLCLASLEKLATLYGMAPSCKKITPELESASSEFQAAFLKGLFDADSSVQGNQEKGISVRLAQSNLEILQAAQRMLLRQGIVSTLYQNRRPAEVRSLPDGRGGYRDYPAQSQHELVVSQENLRTFADRIGFEDLDRRFKLEGLLSVYKQDLNRERFVVTVDSVTPARSGQVYDVKVPQIHAFDANGFHAHNCGEQALLPWEACNLGSINLARFVEPSGALGTATSPESRIRWKSLADTAALAVRFLDDVIDVNAYPKPQIEEVVKGNRKIGLGVMGWADMLFRLGVPYDSEQALSLARSVMRFVRDEGWKASQDLARDRGPFPNWPSSAWASGHRYFKAGAPMRNSMVTTVAPTGTISILAGCSAGIEPLYSLAFVRQILNGERLLEIHPYFQEVAEREKFASPGLTERLARDGSCRGIDEIPARWRDIFACAHDVAPEGHLRMQSAFQESTDNAVSKTVNFPAEATPEDVRRVFDLALEGNVKGITVYRDRSRNVQPMALKNAPATAVPAPGGPLSDVVGRLVGLALAHGAPPEEVGQALEGAAGRAREACPQCGAALRYEEGCTRCSCGYSKC